MGLPWFQINMVSWKIFSVYVLKCMSSSLVGSAVEILAEEYIYHPINQL
jgi:hypothetical protein